MGPLLYCRRQSDLYRLLGLCLQSDLYRLLGRCLRLIQYHPHLLGQYHPLGQYRPLGPLLYCRHQLDLCLLRLLDLFLQLVQWLRLDLYLQ